MRMLPPGLRQSTARQEQQQLAVQMQQEEAELEGKARPKAPPRPTGQLPCCPRCNSNDTKFCYYNNHNVKQPRYYCRVSTAQGWSRKQRKEGGGGGDAVCWVLCV